jgi:simple sugar transport system permease protein
VAALFGGLHPLWTIPASFLFGGLLVGGNAMQRAIQVPSALILALNGLVVVFVVATDRWRRTIADRASQAETAARLAAAGNEEAHPPDPPPPDPPPPDPPPPEEDPG